MFDDDDDPELQFNVVDNYHFEDAMDGPVCFSILPLKFDEDDEVACLDSKVDLHGVADNGLHTVHKEVVAWRVRFDYERPKILVLSSEGRWIELLRPRKCYEKTVRSILISLQMLHYVRKWPTKGMRSLLDYLCEAFKKFDHKPTEYDLKKNHSIIKLLAGTNRTLMKSRIVRMFIEDTSRKIRKGIGSKEMSVASISDNEEDFVNDNDDDYDDKDATSDDDTDNDDNSDSKDDNSDCDYSSNDDGKDDNDIDINDDATDELCAICDNGGKLLSCVGQCKRSFHPTKKDGRDSSCKTLGLTSAKVKEINQYLCKNCEYKQHQCFKCGKLESSNGANAKVFQCYKESCGHFYHPSCVAKLLEPHDSDGTCELENRIAAGMPFTCPAHWCSKCGKMEDNTQLGLWLAACRRCPVAYHKKCLPSKISFMKKHRTSIRAWLLGDRIIIYCECHKMLDTIGTPCRDHIKLPLMTEIKGTRDLGKKKADVTGKRKRNADQGSIESAKLSSKLYREGDQPQRVATNNLTEHIVLKDRGVPKKVTIHANQTSNDEVDSLIVEKCAEGGENNFKTVKGREAHREDLIPGKEMIQINKVSLHNSSITPDYADCLPPGMQVQIACVEKAATKSDGGQEVKESYGQSRKTGEPKEAATVCKMQDLGRTRKNVHRKDGRDSCYEDGSYGRLDNQKEPDVPAYNFGDNYLSRFRFSPSKSSCRRNDDQRATDTSEYKSGDGTGTNSKMWRNHNRVNPYSRNSHKGRINPQKRSMDYSLERPGLNYHRSSDGDADRRWSCRDDYSSDGSLGRQSIPQLSAFPPKFGTIRRPPSYPTRAEHTTIKRRGPLSYPTRAEITTIERRGSPSYPTSAEHTAIERRGSPSYPTRAEHTTIERRGSPSYSRRYEHAASRRRGTVPVPCDPPYAEYDECTKPEYRGYHAMDTPPVDGYSLRRNYAGAYGPQTDTSTDQLAAFHGGPRYGARSDHRQSDMLHQDDRARAAGSVTEKYSPHIERTNDPPIRPRWHQNYT